MAPARIPHRVRVPGGIAQSLRSWRGHVLAHDLQVSWLEENPMIEARHPVQVVVAYDFSPSSEQALARAIEVAARAPQHVLHILAALDPHDKLAGGGWLRGVSYQTAEEVQKLITRSVTEKFAGRDTASE